MRFTLTGNGAARGMALGRARLEQPSRYLIDERPLAAEEVEASSSGSTRALALARAELAALREKLHGVLRARSRRVHRRAQPDPGRPRAQRRSRRSGPRRPLSRQRGAEDAARSTRRGVRGDGRSVPAQPKGRHRPRHRARAGGAGARIEREERKLAARVGEILVGDTVAPSELVHARRARRARRRADVRKPALAQRDPGALAAPADDRRRARGARAYPGR